MLRKKRRAPTTAGVQEKAAEAQEQAAEAQSVRDELQRFENTLANKVPAATPPCVACYPLRAVTQHHTSEHWMEIEKLPNGSWRTFRVHNAAALCEVKAKVKVDKEGE